MSQVKVVSSKAVQKLGTGMLKGTSGKKYSGVGGIGIDRTNKVCFVVAETADKSCAALFSAPLAKVQKGVATWSCVGEWKGTGESQTVAGHPNDVCCKPSGKNTHVYIAANRVGKGILRLTVDNARRKVTKKSTFRLYDGDEKAVGSIGFSVAANKLVVRCGGLTSDYRMNCYVGNCRSDGTFGWTSRFSLNVGAEVQVPGHGTMSFLKWFGQGIAFYKGHIYLTMSSSPKDGNPDPTKYKSVMVAFHVGDLASVQNGASYDPAWYMFDKITFNSKPTDKFEFEGVDFFSDKAFVATNEARDGGGDCIRNYVV